MIEKIDFSEYQEYNKIFKTQIASIQEYVEINILNDNSKESYNYYLFDENENGIRRVIKRNNDACLITTFDNKNNKSYIDIICYAKDHTINKLIKIDFRSDGFNYIEKTISNSDAIIIYIKQKDKVIEMSFTPVPIQIRCPILEISKKNGHSVKYLFSKKNGHSVTYFFGHGLYEKPNSIESGKVEYILNDEDGNYSLYEAGLITKLKNFLSGNKTKTLQEVEKELKVSYPLNDKLLDILQRHMIYYRDISTPNSIRRYKTMHYVKENGLKRPDELNKVLHEINWKRISDGEMPYEELFSFKLWSNDNDVVPFGENPDDCYDGKSIDGNPNHIEGFEYCPDYDGYSDDIEL